MCFSALRAHASWLPVNFDVRALMTQPRTATVWVNFRTKVEGGRTDAVALATSQYRPHLRVAGGEYLGVSFVAGPSEPVQPGSSALATVAFMYEPSVSYADLTEGVNFEVLEGPNIVGIGHVIHVTPVGKNGRAEP